MTKLKSGIVTSLSEIFRSMQSGNGPEGYFALYAPPDQEALPASEYLIAEPVSVDDDLEEHIPTFASERGLEFAFSDETLETVLTYAKTREPKADPTRLSELLDYYSKHDTFPSS